MIFTLVLFSLFQLAVMAQDNSGGGSGSSSSTTSTQSSKSVDVSVSESTDWYTSPWVWIVGAAVFVLLLVALLSGGRSRRSAASTDRVTVTKTVERDTDV